MTTSLAFSSFNVLVPELSRIGQGRIEEIPRESLLHGSKVIAASLKLEVPSGKITDLFLLPNSENYTEPLRGLTEIRDQMMKHAKHERSFLGIKAHPRERNSLVIGRIRELGDYLIPHWAPAEALIDFVQPEVTVHCELTTYVVSSRIQLPDRRVKLSSNTSGEVGKALARWDSAIELVEPN